MTKKVHSAISSIVTTGIPIDPMHQTAYDVYSNILNMISPLDNHAGCTNVLTDDTLKLFLTSFDYRSGTFSDDVTTFCNHMTPIIKVFARSGDIQLIVVTSILLYAKSTDICNDSCNKLINDILSSSPDDSSDVMSQINTTIALLSSNIVGQQSLELETKFQTNELISAFGDFLGSECISGSSAINVAVPECYMRSMQEWGIDVSKFLRMNQCVVDGKPISSSEMTLLINSLQLDTNAIDFESFKPTIYDILNIRFCWGFRWIFQWILTTPSEDTGKLILDTVTGCLLETDKKFIELGYSYLTLVEIMFNCLYATFGGLYDSKNNKHQKQYAYYAFIRAKQLVHSSQPSGLLDVSYIKDIEKLHAIYREVSELQKKILCSLKELGFVPPVDKGSQQQSLMESLIQIIQSSEPYNGSSVVFEDASNIVYEESSAMIQLFSTLEQLGSSNPSEEAQEVMKLLNESAELSTTLCYTLEEGMTILPWLAYNSNN